MDNRRKNRYWDNGPRKSKRYTDIQTRSQNWPYQHYATIISMKQWHKDSASEGLVQIIDVPDG